MLSKIQLKTKDYLIGDIALQVGDKSTIFLANRSLANWSDHPFDKIKVKIMSVTVLPSLPFNVNPGWIYEYKEIENENN